MQQVNSPCLPTVSDILSYLVRVSAGLAASSVIGPILSPVATKLKSSVSAVSKPQEGETDLHVQSQNF